MEAGVFADAIKHDIKSKNPTTRRKDIKLVCYRLQITVFFWVGVQDEKS